MHLAQNKYLLKIILEETPSSHHNKFDLVVTLFLRVESSLLIHSDDGFYTICLGAKCIKQEKEMEFGAPVISVFLFLFQS